jgi:type IV secretion system protein VirB11
LVISGGTSSGKTTLINALLKEIPAEERLIVIEDEPELKLDHPNAIVLIGVRGELGEARVDAEMLLQASLRMRPDRILLGELRGGEAFTFLRAINTGHPGSITTIHADSAQGALDQIVMLALLNGTNLQWDALARYAEQVIDLLVHIERQNGIRRVVEMRRVGARPI